MKYISKNELKNNFVMRSKKIRTCSTDDDAQVLYSFSGT